MISDRYIEERIRSGLLALAPEHIRGQVLADTFDQTRRMAQVSTGHWWRSVARRAMPLAVATGGVAVVLVAIGIVFRGTETLAPPGPVVSTIGRVWASDATVAATIERAPADDGHYYWRAVAYDRIERDALSLSGTTTVVRAPGAQVLAGLAEDVTRPDLRRFTFTVRPGTSAAPIVLSPGTPLFVDRRVSVTTVGRDGYLGMLAMDNVGPYTATSLVPDASGGALSATAELRAAGTNYPPEVASLYTVVAAGVFGPNLVALQSEIVRTSSSSAPFDLAERLVEVLRGADYTYDTDVRDIDCGTMSTAECFAATRRGYCEHYAVTMATVLRYLGVPARVVEGFLPGQRSPGSSTEIIRTLDAHAWVEVYFPGHGWVAFDPTPDPAPASVSPTTP